MPPRFYATNLVWEGFGVGSSFPHEGEGDEERDGVGAAKKPKIVDDDKTDEGSDSLGPVSRLAMPYTVEEEAWLRSRLEKFSAAYNEVSLGEEFRNEFVMFSYDVPLSKRFVPNEIAAFAERGRRIMRTHPEFSGLSDAEQGELCRESVHKAAALFSVRAESLRTGFEQLMFCFGDEDSDNWSQSTGSLISQSKIRKVLISDWNETSHAMDTDTALAYLTLTGQLSAAVENAEMFQIVALMSLFNGARAQSAAGELAKVGQKYSTVLQRRIAANNGSYDSVRAAIDKVDELANIFQDLQMF